MLVNATDLLNPDTPVSPVSLAAATATPIYTVGAETTGGVTGGAGTGSAPEHNGVLVSADSANTATVYLLLGPGTVSATNWHIVLPAGSLWDGTIGGTVWRGAISGFSSAAAKVGIAIS
jgi:hypothetical protein